MKNTVIYEAIVEKAKALDEDIFAIMSENAIRLTVNDFEGFDDNWREITRDLDDEQGVQELLEYIIANALEAHSDTLYTRYTFEDFAVTVGYASYDI